MDCRHCKRDCHPYFYRKYDGFCLECSNAGVPDLLDKIAELERKIERLEDELMVRRLRSTCRTE